MKQTKAVSSQAYVRRLQLSMALFALFLGMQGSTLVLYVLHMGGSAAQVGIIAGISSVMAMFFRPLSGIIIDGKGRRFVLSSGMAIYILSSLGYALAPNIPVLIAAKILFGVGLCATSSATGAILSDLMPDNLTTGLFDLGAVQILGGLLAPTIGIYIAGRWGYPFLYVLTTIGFALTFVQSLSIDYEKHKTEFPSGMRPTADRLHRKQALIEKTAIYPALCMLFFGLAQCSIVSFVPSFGKTIQIENVGFFFIINGVTTLAFRPVLNWFSFEKYMNKIFYTGSFIFIGALVLFILSANAIWMGVAAIFFAIGYSSTQPVLNSMAMTLAPADRKGAANSTYFIAWDFGFGFGSIVLGAVAGRFDYPAIFMIGIISMGVALAVFKLKLAPLANAGETGV